MEGDMDKDMFIVEEYYDKQRKDAIVLYKSISSHSFVPTRSNYQRSVYSPVKYSKNEIHTTSEDLESTESNDSDENTSKPEVLDANNISVVEMLTSVVDFIKNNDMIRDNSKQEQLALFLQK